MASSFWKDYHEINHIIKDKKYLFFWGASERVERTLKKLSTTNTKKFIIDINQNNVGSTLNNIHIFDIKKLKKIITKSNEFFIIITTSNYNSVIKELDKLSLIRGEHFCNSPTLNKNKLLDDFELLDFNFIISSPDQKVSSSKCGGGIYLFNTMTRKLKKKYSGKTRGLSKHKNHFYFIDMQKGLIKMNKDFKIKKIIKILPKSEPHGVCIDEHGRYAYIGTPGRDSVIKINLIKSKIEDEYFISNLWKENKKDNHHVNDIFINNDKLYISLFSFTGKWLEEKFDGGVLCIDLKSKKRKILTKKIMMPHSITKHKDKFYILESLTGNLRSPFDKKIFEFNNFLRGMTFIDDRNIIVMGMTNHRYPERYFKKNNKSLFFNSGLILFDYKNNISKIYDISMNIKNIHSVTTF